MDEPEIISEESAPQIFQAVCNHIKSYLDDIDWVIVRLNAKLLITTHFESDKLQQSKPDLIVCGEWGSY